MCWIGLRNARGLPLIPILAVILAVVAQGQTKAVSVPFRLVAVGGSDAILIDCRVVDRRGVAMPTECLLDTGASDTIVDLAYQLPSAKDDGTSSVGPDGEKVPVLRQYQTILLPTCPRGTPDLEFNGRVLVRQVRLLVGAKVILGSDFLRRYDAVRIDFKQRRLELE